jgi:phosphomannomutase
LKNYSSKSKLTVVVGRDARISGPMIHNLVVNTLIGLGIDVIDLGLSTTPTVEIAVPLESRRRNNINCFSQSKTMECVEVTQ